MSQITTHILDTSIGKPAQDVALSLQQQYGEGWREIGSGATDSDGRVSNLLAPDVALPAGTYRMVFHTGDYFAASSTPGFYPRVDIQFRIEGDGQHYHVPLLLNPYGYSTYRGS